MREWSRLAVIFYSQSGGHDFVMGREEGRAEQKSRKRRLRWLEKQRKRNEAINKVVVEIEENYDEEEVENAKAFLVDAFTWSGSFSKLGETFNAEDLERIAGDYGLEGFDATFIFDLLEETLPVSKDTE
jgi:1,4-alpha-glucan branching enzyme